jgi:hypothetical protein
MDEKEMVKFLDQRIVEIKALTDDSPQGVNKFLELAQAVGTEHILRATFFKDKEVVMKAAEYLCEVADMMNRFELDARMQQVGPGVLALAVGKKGAFDAQPKEPVKATDEALRALLAQALKENEKPDTAA